MGHRILACQGHSWCSHGHVIGWVILAVAGGAVALVVLAALIGYVRDRAGKPSTRPRRRP